MRLIALAGLLVLASLQLFALSKVWLRTEAPKFVEVEEDAEAGAAAAVVVSPAATTFDTMGFAMQPPSPAFAPPAIRARRAGELWNAAVCELHRHVREHTDAALAELSAQGYSSCSSNNNTRFAGSKCKARGCCGFAKNACCTESGQCEESGVSARVKRKEWERRGKESGSLSCLSLQKSGNEEGYKDYSYAGRDALHAMPALKFFCDEQLHSSSFTRELYEVGVGIFGSEERLLRHLLGTWRSTLVLKGGRKFSFFSAAHDEATSHILRELVFEDGYNLMRFQPGKHDAYLDFGAHIGIPVILAATMFPSLSILTIEPLAPNYFYLRMNLIANGLGGGRGRITAWNRGVGSKSGVPLKTKHYPHASTSSGKHKGMGWEHEVYNTTTVALREAVDFIKNEFKAHLRYFKLDCEGCEWDALRSIEESGLDLAGIEHLFGELHDDQGSADVECGGIFDLCKVKDHTKMFYLDSHCDAWQRKCR